MEIPGTPFSIKPNSTMKLNFVGQWVLLGRRRCPKSFSGVRTFSSEIKQCDGGVSMVQGASRGIGLEFVSAFFLSAALILLNHCFWSNVLSDILVLLSTVGDCGFVNSYYVWRCLKIWLCFMRHLVRWGINWHWRFNTLERTVVICAKLPDLMHMRSAHMRFCPVLL